MVKARAETPAPTARAGVLRAPFSGDFWRHVGYALLSVVWLVPLTVTTLLNMKRQSSGLLFAGLGIYIIIFVVVGVEFERRRADWLLRDGKPGRIRRRPLYICAYILLNLPLAALAAGLVVLWAIGVIRNVVLYPIFDWGSGSVRSWGGPTPAGAVAAHVALGLLILFVAPPVIRWLARLQAHFARRLYRVRTGGKPPGGNG